MQQMKRPTNRYKQTDTHRRKKQDSRQTDRQLGTQADAGYWRRQKTYR